MFNLVRIEGTINYQDSLKLQKKAYEIVSRGESDGILFILEHQPVFTVGTGGGRENLLLSESEIHEKGVEVVDIDRGGNITFHGPGQIVAYPVFNLACLKKDVHWFVNALEETVIIILRDYGIEGSRKKEYKGVWIKDAKVAALGVHAKRWITTHGLSFNVNVDKRFFRMINPCGIKEFDVGNLVDSCEDVDIEEIKNKLATAFEMVFEISFVKANFNNMDMEVIK